MNINKINILLAKYFDGNTSVEEENELLEYYRTKENISEELQPYKKQFELFLSGRNFASDQNDINEKILRKIESIENNKQPAFRKFNIYKLAAAAALLIITGLAGIIYYNIKGDKLQDTYYNPELAYIEAQNALLYISEQMNKGIEPLSNINKINTGTDHLKNLKKMDESLGMLHLVSFINNSSNLKK